MDPDPIIPAPAAAGDAASGEASPLVRYAVVYRLYPTADQAAEMRRWIGTCRALWNHLLACQKLSLELGEGIVTFEEMEAERQRWEREPDCAWRRAPQSHMRQQMIRELGRAMIDFFKSRKGKRAGARLGFPRFKKRRPGGTLYIANTRLRVNPDGTRCDLGKLGAMRLRGRRRIAGRIIAARVRLAADRWYLAVQVEADAPPRTYGRPSRQALGIDVGLKAAVARSDGRVIAAPRFLRKAERRMRRLSRRLSASRPGSNRGRQKARAIARLHARISDCRRDFLHTASTRIVCKAETVCLETLSIRGMARGRLAKSVADAAMGELHRQVSYKAGWAGRRVARIDRYEPSSRTCCRCGQLHDMPLSRRTMRCDCGHVEDRDVNAARNIERAGMERVRRVTPEPASFGEPTRGERGEQASPACPAAPVPLDEPRSEPAERPAIIGGLARRIPARAAEPVARRLKRRERASPGLGPLFEWGHGPTR